jgi:hypothetical protein
MTEGFIMRKVCANMDCGLVLTRHKDVKLERCPICGETLRPDRPPIRKKTSKPAHPRFKLSSGEEVRF